MNASLKEHLCLVLEDTNGLNMRPLYILATSVNFWQISQKTLVHQQTKNDFFPISATIVNIRQHERDIVNTKKLNT